MNKYEVLKKYYGYESFRSNQEEIIDSLCQKKPTLAIMATGSGKSLCFQIPGLILEGLTIVISPLISLIVDQVNALKKRRIKACYLIGDMPLFEVKKVYEELKNETIKFLYLSPERLENETFLKEIANIKISQIVVDEAHSISMWGKDFRKSYQRIPMFIDALNSKPNIALFTATAPDQVVYDITSILHLKKLAIFRNSSDRNNLYYGVVKPKIKFDYLLKCLTKHPKEKVVIYLLTRKKCEELFYKLESLKFNVTYFHGGLDNDLKKQNLTKFSKGMKQIMIATNAFGMGIDIPDIRLVILYELPISLEDLSQQFGRCSRDGGMGECILFFNQKDIKTIEFFIDGDKEKLKSFKKVLKFIETKECLHQFLIKHFDQKEINKCFNCCNCIKHKIKINA